MTVTLREPSGDAHGANTREPAEVSDHFVHVETFTGALVGHNALVGIEFEEPLRFVVTFKGVDEIGAPADTTVTLSCEAALALGSGLRAQIEETTQYLRNRIENDNA